MLHKIGSGWWIDLSLIRSLFIDYEEEEAHWYISDVRERFMSRNMEAMKALETALEAYYDVK